MTHRQLQALLVTAVLLFPMTEAAVAQVDLQQKIGALPGAPTSRPQSDAAAAMRSSGLALVPEDFALLKLAPGFLVGLNVLDDPDFTGSFRIDQQGDLALPILGVVHVAGETASEARLQIQKRLLDGQILKDPQVDLSVLEYTVPEVTVVGEVGIPGKYPLLVPRRLVDVLVLAGGTTLLAGNEVEISRGKEGGESLLVHYSKATDPKTIEDVLVNPGDTVHVKRAGIVYVLGAVNKPGGYVMQEDGTISLLQAISLANGTMFTASSAMVHILRKNPDGTEADIALPYDKISKGKIADVQLHATDVLYVPTNKVKSFVMNTQSILATVASSSIYAGIIR
jgi:polysaccharide export outer membrane protein